MVSLTSKKSAFTVLLIVIALSSITALTQFGGSVAPPVGPGVTGSSASTSSQQQSTISVSGSGQSAALAIGFTQVYDSLSAMPGTTLNYTVTVSQYVASSRHVVLSASSTVPGVTLTLNPKEFDFLGFQEGVVVRISVAPTVNSSILPVEITASTVDGATHATFDFVLDKALIVVLPGSALTPGTLHVSVGQKVKWLDLVETDDDGNGYVNVALTDGSAASPTMTLNDVWSHTFDKPGTYPYQVTVSGFQTLPGVLVVG